MKIMSRLVVESVKWAGPFRATLRGRLWLFNRVSGLFLDENLTDARARSLFRIKGRIAKSRPPGMPSKSNYEIETIDSSFHRVCTGRYPTRIGLLPA
jgi:hypothetical protein